MARSKLIELVGIDKNGVKERVSALKDSILACEGDATKIQEVLNASLKATDFICIRKREGRNTIKIGTSPINVTIR